MSRLPVRQGGAVTVSVIISTPKEWDKATALAVLDAYIEGLERGYILTLTSKKEGA
jgi:hypothetical protein